MEEIYRVSGLNPLVNTPGQYPPVNIPLGNIPIGQYPPRKKSPQSISPGSISPLDIITLVQIPLYRAVSVTFYKSWLKFIQQTLKEILQATPRK